MADQRIDHRTPEEIASAQKSLVKILAVATGIPVLWVTLMSINGVMNSADGATAPGGVGVYWLMVGWGLLSPVVWFVGNGYTWMQINKGNMSAGRYMPLLPAFWIIFWFVAGMVG
ncbi:MAG TPA: hypothetical protein VIN57_06635 [Magnetovibrio sp.]